MAIALRGSTNNGAGTGITNIVTLNKPTGTASGDVLLAVITEDGNTASGLTPPSGWTLLDSAVVLTGNKLYGGLYKKIAGGSEPTSYSWGNATGFTDATLIGYSGVDNTTPFDVTGTHASGSANLTVSGITTVTNGAELLICGGNWTGNTPTATAGFTNRSGQTDGSAIFDKSQSTAGATGSVAYNGGSTEQVAFLVALRPAGAATNSLTTQTRAKFLVRAGLTAQTRAKFLTRTGLTAQTRAKFLSRVALQAQTRAKFLIAKVLKTATQARFLIAKRLTEQTQARFLVAKRLTEQARSRFLLRTGLTTQTRAKFSLRTALQTATRSIFKIAASGTKALTTAARVRFIERTVLGTPGRAAFSIRRSQQAQTRARYAIRFTLSERARSKYFIRFSLSTPTRARFLLRMVLAAKARSRFVVRSALATLARSKFLIFFTGRALPLLVTQGIQANLLSAVSGVQKQLLTATQGTVAALLTVTGSTAMVAPFSSIQSPITVKDIAGNPITNLLVVSLTVTYPDGTTAGPYTLGNGVVNTGAGVYTASYVTKDMGRIQEDWALTAADGTTVTKARFTVPVTYQGV